MRILAEKRDNEPIPVRGCMTLYSLCFKRYSKMLIIRGNLNSLMKRSSTVFEKPFMCFMHDNSRKEYPGCFIVVRYTGDKNGIVTNSSRTILL